jgi:hypothetical protein
MTDNNENINNDNINNPESPSVSPAATVAFSAESSPVDSSYVNPYPSDPAFLSAAGIFKNNPESPSVHPSPHVSFSAGGILHPSFQLTGLSRGNSFDSLASCQTSASWNTRQSAVLLPSAAVAAVMKAKDQMGLLNPATSKFNKLNSIDKDILSDLIIVENGSSSRRYTTINNTCQLSLQRHGVDLSRAIADAEGLVLTLQEEGVALKKMEETTERLRDAYQHSLQDVAQQKIILESNSDLHAERVKDMVVLANKYAVTDWIKENPNALEPASVEEARTFIRLHSKDHVLTLTLSTCQIKLRMLKRLGWDKSAYMDKAFGGAMLIKPRNRTVEKSQDLLIAYLRLAPDKEMLQAVEVLHQDKIQAPSNGLESHLSSVLEDLEDEDGDDSTTLNKKRDARELLEELLSSNKKPRHH